jgi:hypothetical protein
MWGEKRIACTELTGKPEGNTPLGRPSIDGKILQ